MIVQPWWEVVTGLVTFAAAWTAISVVLALVLGPTLRLFDRAPLPGR